jgi:RND family efflux transporter MFP subunit
MSFLKQAVVILLMLVIAAAGWLHFDPKAAPLFARLGVPQQLIALVVGDDGANGSNGLARANNRPRSRENSGALVVVSAVGAASINDRISAIGDGEALRSVSVVPLSSGILRNVKVTAGARVKSGDVLAVLDSDTEMIVRDQAALAVETSRHKVSRYESLVESLAASTVQLDEARTEYEAARLAFREAQIALDRRSVVAPIDGIVGIVPVERGDYVTQQTEIATIDDRSSILVDFWVTERFAALVQPEQEVEADSIALPGVIFSGKIQAIGSRVDRDTRTLQLRAIIDNENDKLRPGMSFRVRLTFEGEPFPAVDPLAVQWSSSGPYVWKVIDNQAHRVGIRIIQRNSDYVLVSGDLSNGDEVVTEGIQSLRPGAELNIARRSTAPTQQTARES